MSVVHTNILSQIRLLVADLIVKVCFYTWALQGREAREVIWSYGSSSSSGDLASSVTGTVETLREALGLVFCRTPAALGSKQNTKPGETL